MLIAANNLAPCTPVENIIAIYEAAKNMGDTVHKHHPGRIISCRKR